MSEQFNAAASSTPAAVFPAEAEAVPSPGPPPQGSLAPPTADQIITNLLQVADRFVDTCGVLSRVWSADEGPRMGPVEALSLISAIKDQQTDLAAAFTFCVLPNESAAGLIGKERLFHHLHPGIHEAFEGEDAPDFSSWCNKPSFLLQCLVLWDRIGLRLGVPAVGVAHYTVAALMLAEAVRSADFLVEDQDEALQQVFDLSAVLCRCAEIVDGVEGPDGVSRVNEAVVAIWEAGGTASEFRQVTEWAVNRAVQLGVAEWTAQVRDTFALVQTKAFQNEPTDTLLDVLPTAPVTRWADEFEVRLGRLDELLKRGLITSAEYANRRQEIIESI